MCNTVFCYVLLCFCCIWFYFVLQFVGFKSETNKRYNIKWMWHFHSKTAGRSIRQAYSIWECPRHAGSSLRSSARALEEPRQGRAALPDLMRFNETSIWFIRTNTVAEGRRTVTRRLSTHGSRSTRGRTARLLIGRVQNPPVRGGAAFHNGASVMFCFVFLLHFILFCSLCGSKVKQINITSNECDIHSKTLLFSLKKGVKSNFDNLKFMIIFQFNFSFKMLYWYNKKKKNKKKNCIKVNQFWIHCKYKISININT